MGCNGGKSTIVISYNYKNINSGGGVKKKI